MPQKHTSPLPDFIPTTRNELNALGWDRPDVILITGDTYIDAPQMGVAVVGKLLMRAGFQVGLIAQPEVESDKDITRLGEPALFWGVTSGSIDSMVSNYTATGKFRKSDDLTPGTRNTRRPDRAVIVYANLIRRYFKPTRPIVLGGIEASLRRISHFDAGSKTIRRSILFDAKADLLVYGMAEKAILELAQHIKEGRDVHSIRGLCYINAHCPQPTPEFPDAAILLPDHQSVQKDPFQFTRMFKTFYANADPATAKMLCQKQDTRYLVQNPPQPNLTQAEFDSIHELPFTRNVHPYYARNGAVRALDTIRFSLTTHRGCYGECRFCAIAVHQGRQVISRSETSILKEATAFTSHPEFKGIISDVGGPTANMYAIDCERKSIRGACSNKSCLYPRTCRQLNIDHRPQIRLLRALRKLPKIRKVFIGSGLRYDLISADQKYGQLYLEEILRHHVSGQLKIAPEHIQESILELMGKPGEKQLRDFIALFERLKQKTGKKIFLTYYLMAAHPGCTLADMQTLKRFAQKELRIQPEQVQIFTPTPSTWSTLMYHTGKDPFTGRAIFTEKDPRKKERQKEILTQKERRDPKAKQ